MTQFNLEQLLKCEFCENPFFFIIKETDDFCCMMCKRKFKKEDLK